MDINLLYCIEGLTPNPCYVPVLRFKWRQKQCDVKREVEAHRKNIWLDYRETKVLRILNESVVQMKFHIGDLTDMMSQEFRIVSEDLWAVYPPRAWKLPAQPVDASRGEFNKGKKDYIFTSMRLWTDS